MTTRKKLSWLLLFVLTFMLLFSGCVQLKVDTTVNPDGSGSASASIGIESYIYDMAIEGGAEDPFADILSEAAAQNIQAETYEDDTYTGVRFKQDFTTIESLMCIEPETKSGLTLSQSRKGGKQSMVLSGNFTLGENLKQNLTASEFDLSQVDMKLSITVPLDIVDTNASQVSEDKRTATWDLTQSSDINLTCMGDILLFGVLPVYIVWIVVGVLAVLAIALIIVGIVRRHRVTGQ